MPNLPYHDLTQLQRLHAGRATAGLPTLTPERNRSHAQCKAPTFDLVTSAAGPDATSTFLSLIHPLPSIVTDDKHPLIHREGRIVVRQHHMCVHRQSCGVPG
jgi:hypothetical protein